MEWNEFSTEEEVLSSIRNACSSLVPGRVVEEPIGKYYYIVMPKAAGDLVVLKEVIEKSITSKEKYTKAIGRRAPPLRRLLWRRALPRDVGVGLLRDARPLAAEDGRLARQRDAPMRRAARRPGVVVVVVPKVRHGPLAQRRLLRPLGFVRREGGGERVLVRLRPLRARRYGRPRCGAVRRAAGRQRRAGAPWHGRRQRCGAVRRAAGRPPARGGEGEHALMLSNGNLGL